MLVGLLESHAWRSSGPDVTTRPALTERMRRISYSVAVSVTARPSIVTRRLMWGDEGLELTKCHDNNGSWSRLSVAGARGTDVIVGLFSDVLAWFFPDGLHLAEVLLLSIGLLAQAMFSARFVVQWVVSERRGESVVPIAFWYISLAGGLMLFSYALMRKDIVIMLGQGTAILIYSRNLWLIHRKPRVGSVSPVPVAGAGGET